MAFTLASDFLSVPCFRKIASDNVASLGNDCVGVVDVVDDSLWIRGGVDRWRDERGNGGRGALDPDRT